MTGGRLLVLSCQASEEAAIDKPHVLWVEVGLGIAVAVFAALIVAGQEVGTGAFVAMLSSFLALFIVFVFLAEGAAVRAERRARRAVERPLRSRASHRSAPRGT